VLFGTHPMAPRISPKKSWEGFAGSLLLGTAAVTAVGTLALDLPWPVAVAIGGVLVLVSTGGDLSQSLLKRDLGIKDMGHLLPGHGGVLDRIDSILLAAPTTYLMLDVLLPCTPPRIRRDAPPRPRSRCRPRPTSPARRCPGRRSPWPPASCRCGPPAAGSRPCTSRTSRSPSGSPPSRRWACRASAPSSCRSTTSSTSPPLRRTSRTFPATVATSSSNASSRRC